MNNQKQILREAFSMIENAMSDEMANFLSDMICARLIQTLLFKEARCIALYCATRNEVRTSKLIEKYHTKKRIVLPVIAGENMHFHPYTGKDNLKKGAFGILEPVSEEIIPPESIDLFIVPGMAFDAGCNRLGRGKGYYDRYLSGIDRPIIGLCFGYQLLESIPHETHDKKMTFILTENSIALPHNI